MPAITMTAAEIQTEIGRTATRTVATPAPPLDGGVKIHVYRGDGGALRAVVAWSGEAVDVAIAEAIPVADRAKFRECLGRLLVHARETVGAA